VCVKFVCYSFFLSQRVAMDLTEKLHYAIRVSHLSASNIDGLSTYEISFGS